MGRSSATELRLKLEGVGRKRGDHHEAGRALDRRTGDVLIEAREMPGLSMVEASKLLGLSRPTAYCFLAEAQSRRKTALRSGGGA